jgi:hypothetical protein
MFRKSHPVMSRCLFPAVVSLIETIGNCIGCRLHFVSHETSFSARSRLTFPTDPSVCSTSKMTISFPGQRAPQDQTVARWLIRCIIVHSTPSEMTRNFKKSACRRGRIVFAVRPLSFLDRTSNGKGCRCESGQCAQGFDRILS